MDNNAFFNLNIAEGDLVKTDNHRYEVTDLKEDGVEVERWQADNREYSFEEFSRILNFTQELQVVRNR